MVRSRRTSSQSDPSASTKPAKHYRLPLPSFALFVAVLGSIVAIASLASTPPTRHDLRSLTLVPIIVVGVFGVRTGWRLARRRAPAVDRFAIWFGALLTALGTVGPLTITMSGPSLVATLWVPPPTVGVLPAVTLGVMFMFIVSQCVSATKTAWTEHGRAHLRSELARLGSAAPFLFPVALFINVLLLFAVATSYLVAWGVASFTQDEPSNARIVAFYCWHFLDLVPLVDIPQTLHWLEPLTYPNWHIGVLVLGFELTGVLPVIALIRAFWRLRAAHEPNTDAP